MNQAQIVKKYLINPRDVDIPASGFPFVTISRQAGTEGHAFGRYVVSQMNEQTESPLFQGWDLFDQKLCALIAVNKSLESDYDSMVEEKYRKEGLQQMAYEMLIGKPQQYTLQKKIDDVIRLLARLGKVIIVGRAGVLLTRDMPGGIHIRLQAEDPYRIKNIMAEYNFSEKDAIRKMRSLDTERAKFLREYHHWDIREKSVYDLIWNVDHVRPSEFTRSMCALIEQRYRVMQEQKTQRSLTMDYSQSF